MVFKLDRALGRARSRSRRAASLPDYMAEHRFAEPVTSGGLSLPRSILSLAESLCGLLEERGEGARALEASVLSRRRRGPPHRRRNRAGPARSQNHRTAVPRAAGCAGRSARSRLRLRSHPSWRAACRTPCTRESSGSMRNPMTDKEIAISDRPAGGALRLASHPHLPAAGHAYSRSRRRRGAGAICQPDHESPGKNCAVPGEAPRRPLRMLPKPEPIDVMARSTGRSTACAFRWRRAAACGRPRRRSRTHRHGMVAQRRSPQPTRDYFRVEDEAGPALLALSRRAVMSARPIAPRWYVHGLFA